MSGTLDLLVAGGGPVGLAVAIEARLAGLGVTVVEPRRGPIDKACGEGLMPAAVQALARLGVEVGGVPFHGIRYLGWGAQAEHRFGSGSGRGVRRVALHEAFRERAASLGVRWVDGRVRDVRQDASGVEAAGIRARWLVGADGLHSAVRRSLGVDRPAQRHRRFGQRQHLALAPWSDLVEVYWSERAEVYVTPVAADAVGVAVLGERGTGFAETVGQVPVLRDRVAGAAPLGPRLGAGPLRQRAARVQVGRVLLVGDAAGYMDALTGEGVRVGLACAQAAVEAVVAADPGAYPRRWSALTREPRWLTGGLVYGTRPLPVRRALVPAARAVPWAFAAAVERLAG
jgi:menaquinone-9 beta-reductase